MMDYSQIQTQIQNRLQTPYSSVFNLTGKTAAVFGVANRDSIAWHIANALHQAGAKVIIGYQQRFLSRVRPLLDEQPEIYGHRCDVTHPDELERFFQLFNLVGLDIVVHSIAYGSPPVFTEPPSQVNAIDFAETLEVSAHSLAKIVRYSKPYLRPWSSVLTLTFQASQRAMPMYGMMGVAKAALESMVRYLSIELGENRTRINAISAGPIETLASLSEVIAFQKKSELLQETLNTHSTKTPTQSTDATHAQTEPANTLQQAKHAWHDIQEHFAKHSPIPEKLVARDIADSALFFASDASRKITGQILHVDCGFSACSL